MYEISSSAYIYRMQKNKTKKPTRVRGHKDLSYNIQGLVPAPDSQMLLKHFKNSLTYTSQKSCKTFENSYHTQFKRSSFIVWGYFST